MHLVHNTGWDESRWEYEGPLRLKVGLHPMDDGRMWKDFKRCGAVTQISKYLCNDNEGFPGGSDGKESASMRKTWVQSLGWEGLQEKGMATHSSVLPGELHGQRSKQRLWSSGLWRVRQDLASTPSLSVTMWGRDGRRQSLKQGDQWSQASRPHHPVCVRRDKRVGVALADGTDESSLVTDGLWWFVAGD